MTSSNDRPGYSVEGSGDPVVLLDWTPWESRVLADSLATHYRVMYIDPPTETADADEVAAAVAGAAEAAGLDTYAVVGVSLGADAALQVALLRPQSVSTLVLVSPTCVAPSGARPWHTPELAASAMLARPHPNPPPEGEGRAEGIALAQAWNALRCYHPWPNSGGQRPAPPRGWPNWPAPLWLCSDRRTGWCRERPGGSGRPRFPTAACPTSMTPGTPSPLTAPMP